MNSANCIGADSESQQHSTLRAGSPSDVAAWRAPEREPGPSSRKGVPASFPPHTTRGKHGQGRKRLARDQRGKTLDE